MEIAASVLPLDDISNDSLGLHATTAIVEIGELVRNLRVHWQEARFPLLDLILVLFRILSQVGEDRVQPVHRGDLIL